VITQGWTRPFSVAPLSLCRLRTIGVCDPGGRQTKRYLTGRNGKKLLVTGTPARHGPIGVDAGDVLGFALGAEKPGDLIYITGDTLWFEGTADVAREFSPKVVILYTGAAELADAFT
jgi:hypothetical protein